MYLKVQHTSASLCLNENADPDVRVDMEMGLNKLVPENWPYTHTAEGPDDMPGHIKNAIIGSSLNIPITNGKLNLGTWQGIWLLEHRDYASGRRVVVTLQGEKK
ncbi:25495_t:CDS:2 [Gigaspora margarita]|uniref:25495_t:CDS:1 n=1 Tax=Gigaspora margarita TaxID=4874 RepID=A0ABM8VZY5_GIGMA|nr:25495_t:CDS:2 [Gigaspora margarita]